MKMYAGEVRSKDKIYAASKELPSWVYRLYPSYSKVRRLWKKYKLAGDEYMYMIWKQNNKCAACEQIFNAKDRLPCVDHDHITREIRGLLCSQCNIALGLLGEDANKIIKLATYIAQHKTP